MKQLSDFHIDKCYKDVTENHTRFTVTATVIAVFHSVMTISTFLILLESVRYYREEYLHKKSCRNVLFHVLPIFFHWQGSHISNIASERAETNGKK